MRPLYRSKGHLSACCCCFPRYVQHGAWPTPSHRLRAHRRTLNLRSIICRALSALRNVFVFDQLPSVALLPFLPCPSVPRPMWGWISVFALVYSGFSSSFIYHCIVPLRCMLHRGPTRGEWCVERRDCQSDNLELIFWLNITKSRCSNKLMSMPSDAKLIMYFFDLSTNVYLSWSMQLCKEDSDLGT